ncbi:BNR-4 repeat-containing protein [Patescibacteria group bacterium]|nr:BNR-4 repeat-containing protein [Patescibacteria group bacterium]
MNQLLKVTFKLLCLTIFVLGLTSNLFFDNNPFVQAQGSEFQIGEETGRILRVEHATEAVVHTYLNRADFNMAIATAMIDSEERIFLAYMKNTGAEKGGQAAIEIAMLENDQWSYQIIDDETLADSHNVASLVVDGENYIHITYDMHDTPWKYKVSACPGTIECGFEDRPSQLPGEMISYPRYWRTPNGDLLHGWRADILNSENWPEGTVEGGERMAAQAFAFYDTSQKEWKDAQVVGGDGSFNGDEYGWSNGSGGVGIGPDGRIHTVWGWIKWDEFGNQGGSPYVYDFSYAWKYQDDLIWHNRYDVPYYSLPIGRTEADIIVPKEDFEKNSLCPYVLVDLNNTVHLIFETGYDENTSIYHLKFPYNGDWTSPEKIMNGWYPDAAIDQDGTLTVISYNGKLARSLDGGDTWATEEPFDIFPSDILEADGFSSVKIDQAYMYDTGKLRLYAVTRGSLYLIDIELVSTAGTSPIATPPPSIPGDLDGDWDVDIFDLVIVGNSFGKSPGESGYDSRADADTSGGAIDIFDLITVGSHFGDVG